MIALLLCYDGILSAADGISNPNSDPAFSMLMFKSDFWDKAVEFFVINDLVYVSLLLVV